MRYSLRRALSSDSIDGGTHNPKVGGSNHPAPTLKAVDYPQGPFTLFLMYHYVYEASRFPRFGQICQIPAVENIPFLHVKSEN
jgi:hypothetical protein